MHIYLAKSSRFESTDFASVMIDDVGCSRRHQCPQCAAAARHSDDDFLDVNDLVRTTSANFRPRIMDIHKSNIHNRIMDIHNWINDIHKSIMDIHKLARILDIQNIIMDVRNIIMDIHKSILDIHNSIVDIHNWIMDIHKRMAFMDIHNS